ncbi:MAG: flagellar export protein FliJ [Gemmatimonas sp.]|uniref:flagellar export protein FliJ n=1 Tax=Gemmatimonas sp. TaxID=1962908 RepID=UPI0022C0B600|nr:flagellar export protein FliJ [Gemmatimonas sp.]MCZ8011526.1 flagellar export protein FliJ [Gemmatimonas sp.]MCZ8267863.1 flagellar export protein FliJ [Gemmatimonas sp.]
MSFRFRLQRLLELREQHEQAKARELAAAQDVAEQAEQAREALAALRADSHAHVHRATRRETRIGHLQQLGTVLASLDERLVLATDVCRQADEGVEAAQKTLEEAARDRRVLDRLKERHTDVWRTEEAARDRVRMDEAALTQFARKQEETTTAPAENAG